MPLVRCTPVIKKGHLVKIFIFNVNYHFHGFPKPSFLMMLKNFHVDLDPNSTIWTLYSLVSKIEIHSSTVKNNFLNFLF